MQIGINTTPLSTTSGHKVRGSGMYLKNLLNTLKSTDNNNSYKEFTSKIPKDCDVIHFPYFDFFFLTLPQRVSKKYIVTVHDVIPIKFKKHFPPGKKGMFKWYLQRRALQKAQAIITDSEASKADIQTYANVHKSKIHVVPLAPAIDTRIKPSNDIVKKYNLPENYALYVGDVTWNKNLPRLVKAAIQAKVPLVLVGKSIAEKDFDKSNPENKDRIVVQKMADKSECIHILGFVSQQDLIALYKKATYFAMPSLYEGFGLPILEAMALGVPVLTSNEGSLKEVAGNAALVVDPFSEKSMVEAMKKLFQNKELRMKLSEKGRINARRYTWKKTAEKTIKIYELVHNK